MGCAHEWCGVKPLEDLEHPCKPCSTLLLGVAFSSTACECLMDASEVQRTSIGGWDIRSD